VLRQKGPEPARVTNAQPFKLAQGHDVELLDFVSPPGHCGASMSVRDGGRFTEDVRRFGEQHTNPKAQVTVADSPPLRLLKRSCRT